MKLLFIFTGGTIGSTLSGDVISTERSKSYKIIEAYRQKYTVDFDYDMIEPYTELSENNTGETIARLCGIVREKAACGYDGIVITHGTDTLQYSAAALGYTLGLECVPVCLVSSNRPIENPRANALDNLRGAVNFIQGCCGRGVFVVYRNDNSSVVRVHRATRLIGAKAYSDDVSSIYGCIYGHFDGDRFVKNEGYTEAEDEMTALSADSLSEKNDRIFVLSAHPGMCYPSLNKETEYVIINTYHSGTLDTSSRAAQEFYLMCAERGVTVYAAGVSGGPDYASAQAFGRLGINEMRDISPVSVYVKLWLILSMGMDAHTYMHRSLSGDIMRQV